MPPSALLDSNVVVAALVDVHPHHNPSAALFSVYPPNGLAVAAHSFAEAYNVLTRRGAGGPYQRSPEHAWQALEQVASVTVTVGLTPAQTLDAIGRYAAAGGIGPRLYDHLIGEAAVAAGLRRIVTWNVTHLRGLFPSIEVLTPDQV